MKQCPTCKKSYPDTDAFCNECGTPLASAPPPPTDDEPTTKVPPIAQKKPPEPPAPPAPARAPSPKTGAPVGAVIALAVCLVLAAGTAIFAGYQAFQYKDNYISEQNERMAIEDELTDLQKELDKLQLYHDDTASALDDVNRQLDDARSQLADASAQLSDGSSRLGEAEREMEELLTLLRKGYGFASEDYYSSKGVIVLSTNSSATVTVFEDMPEGTVCSSHTPEVGINCQWNGPFTDGQATVTITGTAPGHYTIEMVNDYNSDSFDILVIVTE